MDEALSEFMQETFGIDGNVKYNMADILRTLAAPDIPTVENVAGINAVRESLLACGPEKTRRKRSLTAHVGGVRLGVGIEKSTPPDGQCDGSRRVKSNERGCGCSYYSRLYSPHDPLGAY